MYQATYPNSVTAVTPFSQVPEGMYLVKRLSSYPLIEHYAVLVTGNLVRQLGIPSSEPVVIHQTLPSAIVEWAVVTGTWNIVQQVPPNLVPEALERAAIAFRDPNYDLFANNCEQFARFISEGQKTSTQLRGFVVAGTIVAAIWFFGRDDN